MVTVNADPYGLPQGATTTWPGSGDEFVEPLVVHQVGVQLWGPVATVTAGRITTVNRGVKHM